jgi:uncharacterized membrane protein HdeD (DUF308 family)
MPDGYSDTGPSPAAEAMKRLWWLPLLRGVLLVLVGGYALFQPGMTVAVLTQVIALFVILDGILTLVAGLVGQIPSRLWVIVRGVLEILVGLFVFAYPMLVAGTAATILLFCLAFAAISGGIMEIIAAIQARRQIDGAGWIILGGVLAVLFGVLILLAPLTFGAFIVRVLGIFAILSGVSLIVFAFRVRQLGRRL